MFGHVYLFIAAPNDAVSLGRQLTRLSKANYVLIGYFLKLQAGMTDHRHRHSNKLQYFARLNSVPFLMRTLVEKNSWSL